MFRASIVLRQYWYNSVVESLKVPLIYTKYILYVYFSLREHVVNANGSHIRQRIIIIGTGVFRHIITYHEVC